MLVVKTRKAAARAASRPPADPSSDPPRGATDLPFERAAVVVMDDLRDAMAGLFSAVSEPTSKCADVEAAFGIDPRLAWQVWRIATSANSLAAGTSVPARVSVERLLKSATRRRVPTSVTDRVAAAFEAFERLVEEHAGDRETLEAMLCTYLPEAREKMELANKQAAFKSMSQIRGLVVDVEMVTAFLHPSSDERRVDAASLSLTLGLRRVRPDSHFILSTLSTSSSVKILTLDGIASQDPADYMLPQFCSSPTPQFQTKATVDSFSSFIPDQQMGLRSAVNVVQGQYMPAVRPRYHEPGATESSSLSNVQDRPIKRFTQDIFVHRDIYPGVNPMLHIYEAVSRGYVRVPADPDREIDRLHMQEKIIPIAGGLTHARLAHVPSYAAMLEHVCSKRGWDAAAFRGYRLDVHYPVYGAQYMVSFQLPEVPGAK